MRSTKIALRNLNRQKKRTFLLGGAIAFGILIVTMINSFTGSFVQNVGENFSHIMAGHIFIEGVEKDEDGDTTTIVREDADRILTDILSDIHLPVRHLTRRSELRGLLLFHGNSVSQNIVGADWKAENYFEERLALLEGSFDAMREDPHAIIISEKVADILNVEVRDRIDVRLRTISGQMNVGTFRIAGISYDPGVFGSLSCYANIEYINQLAGLAPGEYMTLGIFLEELQQTDKVAQGIYAELSSRVEMFDRSEAEESDDNPILAMMNQVEEEEWTGTRYRLTTITDALEEVEQIVYILDTAGLVILLILFVIIMVGITNTFRMIMLERTKEIGTMRALGVQKAEIRNLFLLEAFFLSLAGILLGMVLSAAAMLILGNIFWGLDSPIYILLKNGYMTFSLPLLQALRNFAVVIILTLLAAYFPSRRAAEMRPVDALRS